ncbi:MAG: GNAT family N-acetyltransferase [Hyphomicrobiales bacterium]
MAIKYKIFAEIPNIEAYCDLRVAAGLSAKSQEIATIGLPNSCYAVSVKKDDELIGMGRIVGDGAVFLQICDIAVRPEYQGQGIGKAIVQNLTTHLAKNYKGAYVSLIADGDAQYLYAQFGFKPVAPDSIGMAYMVG